MKQASFIAINERENALDCLEKLAGFLDSTDEDPMAWKWAIVAMHGALYGFAVSALRDCPANDIDWNKESRHLMAINVAIEKCAQGEAGNQLAVSPV